ncbi:hypothetical protein KCU98_g2017, partial [Aureobasidium melanogenum]
MTVGSVIESIAIALLVTLAKYDEKCAIDNGELYTNAYDWSRLHKASDKSPVLVDKQVIGGGPTNTITSCQGSTIKWMIDANKISDLNVKGTGFN